MKKLTGIAAASLIVLSGSAFAGLFPDTAIGTETIMTDKSHAGYQALEVGDFQGLNIPTDANSTGLYIGSK